MQKWQSAAAKRIKHLGDCQSIEDSIVSLVERLLADVTCPPTDLNAVMKRLNIASCESDPDMIVPGEIRRTHDELKIYLIPGLAEGRRRFTIAHECGHAILESTGQRCPRKGKELERLCDKIAAELLMPTKIFREQAGIKPTIDHLLELAKNFQASLTTTFIRASELYRIRIFEVQERKITWVAGISPVQFRHTSLAFYERINRAMSEASGKESFEDYIATIDAKWDMEWRCMGKGNKRAFFMLTPSESPS